MFCNSGSKETAFLHAIISAALVHSVSRSCSSGNLIECACDSRRLKRLVGPLSSRQRWSWSGCDDNINYGVWFSETFADPVTSRKRRSRKTMGRLYMNKHNNKAGREVYMRRILFSLNNVLTKDSKITQTMQSSVSNSPLKSVKVSSFLISLSEESFMPFRKVHLFWAVFIDKTQMDNG